MIQKPLAEYKGRKLVQVELRDFCSGRVPTNQLGWSLTNHKMYTYIWGSSKHHYATPGFQCLI